MTGETKNEAFHRLAGQRIERIEDALRVFSNLSGPSYECTEAEVQAYLDRIETGLAAALARFREAKRWPAPEPEIRPEPAAIPDMAPVPTKVDIGLFAPREAEIAQLLRDVDYETLELAELCVMNREVIAGMQRRLDER